MGVYNYKRRKHLKYTEVQRQKAENNSKKFANLFYRPSCNIIIDEETFFCHGRDIPASARFCFMINFIY